MPVNPSMEQLTEQRPTHAPIPKTRSAAALYTVAFQGEPGAYSEEAIAVLWKDTATPLASKTFEAVIDAVHSRVAHYGILPVENTLIGPISAALTSLTEAFARQTGIEIVDQLTLDIHHALLAPIGASMDTLTRVSSHPAALAQCRNFLAAHPHLTVIESYDTAGAAREVSLGNDIQTAAIAGTRAASLYNLQILGEEIQDMPDNQTRFVVIANTRNDRW